MLYDNGLTRKHKLLLIKENHILKTKFHARSDNAEAFKQLID